MTTEIGERNSVTFKVDDVTPADYLLAECKTYKAVRELLGREIESCFNYHKSVVANVNYHALLAAVYTAFSDHRPLILGPDAVWITLAQGVAHHMAIHAERLRPEFVKHEGRISLEVEVSHFAKGSPENPWTEAFTGWSKQIRQHVGQPIYDLLVADFSTTGPVERAVSEVVLMDIFERYFQYRAVCICGIPSVRLEGSVADWERLAEKVEGLARFDLGWWIEHLRPICAQFVAAAKGEPDIGHWKNICKLESDYGGDIVNGWIAKLFPYLKSFYDGPVRTKNPIFDSGKGFQTMYAPSGLSRVPFNWSIARPAAAPLVYCMEAIAGFVGVAQEADTKAIRPMVGWAVAESSPSQAAISRVCREHGTHPPAATPTKDELFQRRTRVAAEIKLNDLPADMGAFYHATDGAELFPSYGTARFSIMKLSELAPFHATAVGIARTLGPMNRPIRWCRFCRLIDGSCVAISIDKYDHDRSAFMRNNRISDAIIDRHAEPILKAEAGIDRELKRIKNENPQIEHYELMTLGWDLRKRSAAHREQEAEFAVMDRVPEEPIHLVVAISPDANHVNGKFRVAAKSFTEFLKRALESNGNYWWLQASDADAETCTLREM